jgi:E3 Ubiquitin ligase
LIPSILLFHSTEPTRLIAWCAIGICGGLYLFFNGFRLLRRRHLILDTPISKIRSASMGMVELSGLAVGPYTLVAPVTGKNCYYHRTLVWEWKQCGRSKRWVKVASECMHVPFFLDDNTGKVMVDPRGAELDLHRDFQEQFCDSLFTIRKEVPPNVHLLLSRHGINTTNKIKVEEFCIKPKNALFVIGTLGENPGIDVGPDPIRDDEHNTLLSGDGLWFNPLGALRNSALSFAGGGGNDYVDYVSASEHTTSTQVIQLSPPASANKAVEMTQQQKVAAALMKAGISNPAAWSAGGVTLSAPAVAVCNASNENGLAVTNFDRHPQVVLMKGKNNPTFLVSWRSQYELARSLGWRCTLMIWGGPALALLCLYVLLTLTHLI